MNSTFKVVFNKARGALMVVNEATSSVQAKGTKTVIAAAVAALMAGGAMAGDLTYDSIVKNEGTFKFLNGKGEATHILTNASVPQLIVDLNNAKDKGLSAIITALGQVNEENKTGIVFGYAGGQNYMEKSSHDLMGIAAEVTDNKTYKHIIEIMQKQFEPLDSNSILILDKGTHTIIGDAEDNTSPIVLGMVGADRVLNLALDKNEIGKQASRSTEIVRHGNSVVEIESGNVIGAIGASSAVNIGSGLTISKKKSLGPFEITGYVYTNASNTTTTLNGDSILNVKGTGCVAGAFAGGSSIAVFDGVSNSTVTGHSYFTLNNSKGNEAHGSINTLAAGIAGGGLAIGMASGDAVSKVEGSTVIDLQNGLAAGVMGGGMALSVDGGTMMDFFNGTLHAENNAFKPINELGKKISEKLKGFSPELTETVKTESGTALTESHDITIKVGTGMTTLGLVGGGIAATYQNNHPASSAVSTAKADNVTILLGGNEAKPDQTFDGAWKSGLISAIKNLGASGGKAKVDKVVEFATAIDDYDGATIGVLGGGIALGYDSMRGDNGEHSPKADASVKNVGIQVNSGYNVALVAGGFAVGSGHSLTGKDVLASANVDEDVLVNIAGGETIGLMGGGVAVWTGSKEAHKGLGVQANVDNVTFNVMGGSVDGLFGGGLAVDDSNPEVGGVYEDARNAEANVGNVNINVAGGKVGRLHVEVFNEVENYPSGEGKDTPDMKLYLKAGLKAIQDGKAAIVGGGMAAGIAEDGSAKDAAGARVEVANINISDGVIGEEKAGMQGNIYGGGIASTGGTTWVGTSNITVAGGTINGDIYGGGLSIGGNYGVGHECYNDALSAVDTANVTLGAGSLKGNVYLGGRVLEDGAKTKGVAKATVGDGTLTIYKDFKFLADDAVIDGSGAESATLNFVNGYDFSKAEASEVALLDLPAGIVIKGFDKLDSGDLVTGANYDMGNKTSVEVTGNYEFGKILNATATQTMTVKEGGALAVQSAQALANNFVVEEGVLALGTTAKTADAREGLGRYNEKAGLYLSGTVNLTNASINVGETKAKNGVNIGSNGTLIVDASVDDGQEGNLSTDVTGKITGEKGSTIHYVHVADKGVVEVEHEGFTTVTVDNLLYKVVKVENEDNQYTFKIATGSELAGTGLEHFDGDALDGMADNEVIGSLLDQANTAITSGSQREARLNGALNLAAAGGVQTAGIEAATMAIDQATKRAALTNVFKDGWTGFAEVTGTSLKMGGDSGALETKTELGGITVGGEYTMGDMTFGVMGNFGTGDVEGEGDNNGAKNDVDYYGVQGYTAKRMGQFNLVGQMGLMTTKNDVTSADGDSADIDATIFTIGARGEMAFQLSKSCQAVPYVGLNFLRVATDGYNTAKGLSVDDMDQNLVSMPIGVAFSGNMDLASGWTLRPTVDVAYVHTFGDTDVEATTKFGAAAINTNLDVWSENVGRVGFGLEARKDALSFGGQIGGAFGDNDHREFYGQLNVKYLF